MFAHKPIAAKRCRTRSSRLRFTLRGKGKVDTQWKLFTLVHNSEKIASYAVA
jgi:hypothetical protein